MIDLTKVEELDSLANVLRLFHDATENVTERTLIVGATARDLILHHTYGLRITRATVDLDLAVSIRSWKTFSRLEERLIERGARRDPKIAHRFFVGEWRIDLVPFGKIERDGVIIWPETEAKMSVAGFDEASDHALDVLLPGQTRAFVASLPALLILKLFAWEDRHLAEPRHDAVDIRTLIGSYAEAWNENRLYTEADDLLERFGHDNDLAGAALLGRDAAAIARPTTLASMLEIVARETSDERLILARDMSRRVEENVNLLNAVLMGFLEIAKSAGSPLRRQ